MSSAMGMLKLGGVDKNILGIRLKGRSLVV
jgi:hypothetical protein